MFKLLTTIAFLITCLNAQLVIPMGEDAEDERRRPSLQKPDELESGDMYAGVLVTASGTQLGGQLLSIDQERRVLWQTEEETIPARMNTDQVDRMVFSDHSPVNPLTPLPLVEVVNGDAFRGKIVSMDQDHLVLETPYAGTLKIQSKWIKRISPDRNSYFLYEGFREGFPGWKLDVNGRDVENKGWTHDDMRLLSHGQEGVMSRELELMPDKIAIEMDLKWEGECKFSLLFWGKEQGEIRKNTYNLYVQRDYLRLYRSNLNPLVQKNMGSATVEGLQNRGGVRLQLFLDHENDNIYLYLDGERIKKWNDFEGVPEDRRFLHIQGFEGRRFSISTMTLRNWEGDFPSGEPERSTTKDRIHVANGDEFDGELMGIENQQVKFKSEVGVFEVPLDRIFRVEFAESSREKVKKVDHPVYLYTPERDRITLGLQHLEDHRAVGTSIVADKLSLDIRYFDLMVFERQP